MVRYRTKTGDMLDAICHQYYAGQVGVTEWVLEANPGLADYGPVLPSGVIIELPDLLPAEPARAIRLWD